MIVVIMTLLRGLQDMFGNKAFVSSPEAGLDLTVSHLKCFSWSHAQKTDILWCFINFNLMQCGFEINYLHSDNWAQISLALGIKDYVSGKIWFVCCPHVYSDSYATIIFWCIIWIGNSWCLSNVGFFDVSFLHFAYFAFKWILKIEWYWFWRVSNWRYWIDNIKFGFMMF